MHKERSSIADHYGKVNPTPSFGGGRYQAAVSGDVCPTVLLDPLEARHYSNARTSYLEPFDLFGINLLPMETLDCTQHPRPEWNSCDHFKRGFKRNLPFSYVMAGIPGYYGLQAVSYIHLRKAWYRPLHALNNNTPDMGLEIDDFFRSRAIASMMPRFESDFQLLNFLFELKDFRDVPRGVYQLLSDSKFWAGIYNWSVRLNNKQFRKKDSYRRGKIVNPHSGSHISAGEFYASRGSSLAANSFLAYTLAYEPLIRDLCAMMANIATEYEIKLAEFKLAGATENTRHYSEDLANSSYYPYGESGDTYDSPTEGIRYTHYVRATASLRYNYNYNLTSSVKGLAKYWGFAGTAENFWNMLPLSFLLDYLLQIAKALKMTEVDTDLDFRPVQYCESLNAILATDRTVRKSTYVCKLIVDDEDTFVNNAPIVVTRIGTQVYKRRVFTEVPKVGLIVPRFHVPSTRQSLTALAIAKVCLF